MSINGKILQIQNFSVNDGDGIRSTIFFAGCPLRCKWCCNPEGLTQEEKIGYYEKTCVHCGKCVKACPFHIDINLNLPESREMCTKCGLCVTACPNHSRKCMVETISSDQIVNFLKPYLQFFRMSGGGVTFSGGEATLQADFLRETAGILYDMGIDLALETSAYFAYETVKDILKLFQTIFVDIKHMNEQKHIYFTGVSNQKIFSNIKKMCELDTEIIVRIPVIEGVNADAENITATAEFVHNHIPKAKIELLPYHRYGESKYEALGINCPPSSFETPEKKKMEEYKKMIEQKGVKTVEYK